MYWLFFHNQNKENMSYLTSRKYGSPGYYYYFVEMIYSVRMYGW